ncbi:MAG: hypothetical protein CML50_13620 [Rhodobacteraceae bacterium]|uniref:Bile acid:Na+ symporter, BASS family n=1 Tax=Salipiger profundus TaxID=1229727 RepID=A0A1U7D6R4_9RHOB|nr:MULTISPECIES: hypothetical protein [Salipiger]APX23813.1 hypothetical protein Ga0080559_TMP3017 [Salipiger profundus]MAB07032.1 hypothetical protein [Paracoccaceae bacterium]GGA18161.1 hypothetical protein GCM10011326_33440 [Salipiger profundus]SFD28365.1 hypothetical protein SAMN05444415_10958 [Salipiger profundus]
MSPLLACARHARWLLVAGLVAGVALPGAASVVRPWLPELVALMLFLAALRIGPRRALGALHELRETAAVTLVWQLVLPLTALTIVATLGGLGTPAALAAILMLAAPPLAGSPNLTMLVGADPAPALRLLVLGTAALPLTVVPVLWGLPALGDAPAVTAAVLRLLTTIVLAAGLAFALRLTVLKQPSERALSQIDGLSALTMTVMVLGLMAAVGPAMTERPVALLGWLALACLANLGPQMVVARLLRGRMPNARVPALAITAGNRNIALFLVALPPQTTEALLLFIGCYQVPMYLTPLLMTRFYRARA